MPDAAMTTALHTICRWVDARDDQPARRPGTGDQGILGTESNPPGEDLEPTVWAEVSAVFDGRQFRGLHQQETEADARSRRDKCVDRQDPGAS